MSEYQSFVAVQERLVRIEGLNAQSYWNGFYSEEAHDRIEGLLSKAADSLKAAHRHYSNSHFIWAASKIATANGYVTKARNLWKASMGN